MKIAAIIDTDITSGGGFNQALNAIIQMSRLCQNTYEFLTLTSRKENIQYLEKLGIHARYYKPSFIDKWIIISATNLVLRRIQSTLKFTGRLEKTLLHENVDLVYFVTPSTQCLSLQQLNYISTIWDICHRDTPEFPEVRTNHTFLAREFIYKNTLSQSLFSICDSNTLAKRISMRYGVDRDRLLVMPFSTSPFIDKDNSKQNIDVLKKYNLKEGYFFYPAQLWAHKNHIRLFQALNILNNTGNKHRLVLCGKDYGLLEYLKKQIIEYGLENQISYLGFVSEDDIRGLYEGCCAVVMPSYFGPTNIPPLEAWNIGKPLIYSTECSEQAGDAALLISPDSAESLSKAMTEILNIDTANKYIAKGKQRLADIECERKLRETQILSRLKNFATRLECWQS